MNTLSSAFKAFGEGFSRSMRLKERRMAQDAALAPARAKAQREREALRSVLAKRKFWLTYKEFVTMTIGIAAVMISAVMLPGVIGAFAYRLVGIAPIIVVMYWLSFLARRSLAARNFLEKSK